MPPLRQQRPDARLQTISGKLNRTSLRRTKPRSNARTLHRGFGLFAQAAFADQVCTGGRELAAQGGDERALVLERVLQRINLLAQVVNLLVLHVAQRVGHLALVDGGAGARDFRRRARAGGLLVALEPDYVPPPQRTARLCGVAGG